MGIRYIALIVLALMLVACGVAQSPTGAGPAVESPVPPGIQATPSTAATITPERPTPLLPGAAQISEPTAVATQLVGAATASLPTASPPLSPTLQSPAIITLDNDGQTIQMKVGESFTLMLGEAFDWNITVVDPQIVSRKVNVTVARGVQGIYEAHAPGRTELTASGRLICAPGTICPMLARGFRLMIEVN